MNKYLEIIQQTTDGSYSVTGSAYCLLFCFILSRLLITMLKTVILQSQYSELATITVHHKKILSLANIHRLSQNNFRHFRLQSRNVEIL